MGWIGVEEVSVGYEGGWTQLRNPNRIAVRRQ